MKEFYQRKVLDYRKFRLHPNRIEVETKEGGKLNRYEIPIEEIGFKKSYQADSNIFSKLIWYFFIVAPFFIIAMYFIINNPETLDMKSTIIASGGFWIVAILGLLHPMQDDVILEGYRNISFYRNKPDEKEVTEFIDEVVKTAKKYQLDRYIDMNEDITKEDLLNRLKYLKEKDIITQEEFEIIFETYTEKRMF